MRRTTLFFISAVVLASQFATLLLDTSIVSADPNDETSSSGRQQIRPERGDNNEYYYYDGDTVVGKAGQYKDSVTFVLDSGKVQIFIPDSDTMEVNQESTRANSERCSSGAVPTKLWSDNSDKEPGFYLNVMASGGIELDLKDDQEDGTFRWGKIKEEIASERSAIPETISGGTLAKDRTSFTRTAPEVFDAAMQDAVAAGITTAIGAATGGSLVGEGAEMYIRSQISAGTIGGHSIRIQDDDIECAFFYYNHFNRLIAPYDDTTTNLKPLGGHILGIRGMKFDDYVVRADNRLMYFAYLETARNITIEHCNDTAAPSTCIKAVDDAWRGCYAEASGKQRRMMNITDSLKDLPEWDKSVDETKFVGCIADKNKLIDDGFFRSKEHLEEFAQQIVNSVVPPMSIRPIDLDPIAEIGDNEAAPSDTQCSIGMMGWILCPVFNFIASMNDKIFTILKNWLVLAPFQQDPGGPNSAAYSTWSQTRNIANVFFVVFFMAIIYAHVTGRGLQSYGLKSLAPRIIVGALLVNLSYIICGVAVDISNVMGDSVYRVLNDVPIQGANIQGLGGWQNVTASITLAGGAAAGGLILLGNLSALVPIMIMAFVALVTTFLVLLFRQALIIIFVAFAPIAFMLFVLPNTKSWFDKWRTIFIQLLLLYPIFALIFAGSQIAAQVVRDTAAINGEELLMIFSLGIQVIPLFLLPLIMKVGGGVLNRFGGIINNPNKGLFDRTKNRAEEFRKDRKVQQQTRALNGSAGALGYGTFIRANQRRQMKHASHKRNADRARQRYLAGKQNKIVSKAGGAFAGKDLKDQIRDHIKTDALKEALEDYEAQKALIEYNPEDYNPDTLKEMANRQGDYATISDSEQMAALDAVFRSKDVASIEEALGQLYAQNKEFTQFQRETILKASSASGIGEIAPHLSQENLTRTLSNPPAGATASSEQFVNQLYATADKNGMFTSTAAAGLDAASYEGIARATAAGAISPENARKIKQNSQFAVNDRKLNRVMSASTRDAERNFNP